MVGLWKFLKKNENGRKWSLNSMFSGVGLCVGFETYFQANGIVVFGGLIFFPYLFWMN